MLFKLTYITLAIVWLFWLSPNSHAEAQLSAKQQLGQQLFFDVNLSLNRNQSCASCHSPEKAFTDPRAVSSTTAGSLGSDKTSIGDRNTPSAAYAASTPAFHKNSDGKYIGGMFWDGRARDLEEQAIGPPLNKAEMGLRTVHEFAERVKETSSYIDSFKTVFGDDVFASDEALFHAASHAIAAFERSNKLSPFDSKYDRYLRGEYKMTKQENLGMTLFFSQQFTNCNQCHQLKKRSLAEGETFSDYSFHNIGVPSNLKLRQRNGVPPETKDLGLSANTGNEARHQGQFKVPSLRNVAITAPYMHNGVFENLETVVAFYNKYNSRSKKNQTNPETGELWRAAEVEQNLSLKELEHGPALEQKRINALIAFMKTLTDKKYEYLLD